MQPEHAIMNAIRLWCGERGILCFRANVGKVETKDGRWFDTGLPKGFSDLVALAPSGVCLFIECKTAKGRQREDQREFQRAVEERGFRYVVARSIGDVEAALRNR